MLPLAHLIPCTLLEDSGAGPNRRVELQCHESLLPLQESGPGYLAFWPIDDLPETGGDLDWPTLLQEPFHRGELILPRSVLFRTLTPEGQLVAFAVGDPFELNPQSYEVDWVEGDLVTLRLTAPIDISALHGPDPPPTPALPLAPVEYEIPSALAQRAFLTGTEQLSAEHYRYACWAPADWPAGLADDPPPLPHLLDPGDPVDNAEEVLVFDPAFIDAARTEGYAQGLAWRSPTGSADDGAVWSLVERRDDRHLHVRWFHYGVAGLVLTSLVAFDLVLQPDSPQRRWANNLPFPTLPPE